MPRRKVSRISTTGWERYKKIVRDFIDMDSGRQPFLWLRKIEQPLPYGEDSGTVYTQEILYCIFLVDSLVKMVS